MANAAAPAPEIRRRAAVEHALLGLLPLLVTGFALAAAYGGNYAAGDFGYFHTAALRLVHGGDPYAWTRPQIAAAISFPYPALTSLLLVPFALIPQGVGGLVFMAANLSAILGAMHLLGVRDWRLYGVVLLWSPVVIGWQTGNLTLLLAFGIAAAWRLRDRPVVVGCVVAALISIKPTMFPLAFWLLATRRYRGLAWMVGTGVACNVVAWSVVGWDMLPRWLHLVSLQSHLVYRTGYGLIALLADAGLTRTPATVIVALAGCAVAVVCLRSTRFRCDRAALTLSVALMLIATPLVDMHYLGLLIVPLALIQPRLHPVWILPVALWLCPAIGPSAWQVVLWWGVAVVVLGTIVRGARGPAVSLAATGETGDGVHGSVAC